MCFVYIFCISFVYTLRQCTICFEKWMKWYYIILYFSEYGTIFFRKNVLYYTILYYILTSKKEWSPWLYMLGFELLVTLYTNFSPKVKHFCKIFGDSFLKCNFAWNSNLKSKIQNFEIDFSCIGLYKEKNP